MSNPVLSHRIELFAANRLVLNLDKTNKIKCVTNNLPHCALSVDCKEKYTEAALNTKFLA
jgi:hypothetical protein